MPSELTYDYAIIRVVPRVERGEQMNVGVILSCVDADFLEARIEVDDARLRALDPTLDLDARAGRAGHVPGGVRRRRRRRPDRRRCRRAAGSAGWCRRAAPSFRRRRCTPAARPTRRRRCSGCSTAWCGRSDEARNLDSSYGQSSFRGTLLSCSSRRSARASDTGSRHDADVPGARPNELTGRVLLDRVADPADGAADREERQRRTGRQAQHARRPPPARSRGSAARQRRGCRRRDLADEDQLGGPRRSARAAVEQRRGARIAVADRADGRSRRSRSPRCSRAAIARRRSVRAPAQRRQHRLDAGARAAVPGPSSAASPAITTAYGRRACGRDAARRERRHVQLVIGAQHRARRAAARRRVA